MRRTRQHPPLALEVLTGAAGGALGAWLMSPTQQVLGRFQSEASKARESSASDENATVKATRTFARLLGLPYPEDKAKQAKIGLAFHYVFGAAWGALYALVHRRLPGRAFLSGLVFGAGLWLVSDEIGVTVARFAPPPNRYPLSTHLKALGGHLVYGLSADTALRTSDRVFA